MGIHTGLCDNDTTVENPPANSVRCEGQPKKTDSAEEVACSDMETTLAEGVTAVCQRNRPEQGTDASDRVEAVSLEASEA